MASYALSDPARGAQRSGLCAGIGQVSALPMSTGHVNCVKVCCEILDNLGCHLWHGLRCIVTEDGPIRLAVLETLMCFAILSWLPRSVLLHICRFLVSFCA